MMLSPMLLKISIETYETEVFTNSLDFRKQSYMFCSNPFKVIRCRWCTDRAVVRIHYLKIQLFTGTASPDSEFESPEENSALRMT